MKIQSHWKAFSILVMVLGAIWIALTFLLVPGQATALTAAPRPGFLAADFDLSTTAGSAVRLSSLSGKVVILNFWASWCTPCQAEMPALQSVYEKYSDSGLVILAVNSTIQDDPRSAEEFALQKALTFPVLLDTSGAATRLYQVRALPTTFFIDQSGIIREMAFGGPLSETYLLSQVESLLSGGR